MSKAYRRMASTIVHSNVGKTLRLILQHVGVGSHHHALYERMAQHPDFPSLLAFQHTLKSVGVDSLALRTTLDELRNDLPKPAMVHVSTNVELYLLVECMDANNVYVLDAQGNTEAMPIDTFVKVWDGVAFVFDTEQRATYSPTVAERLLGWFRRHRWTFAASTLALLLLWTIALRWVDMPTAAWAFVAVYAIGLCFAVLLQVQGFDQHNPMVRRVCGHGSHGGCTSILSSSAASFLGVLHWSDVGALYFTTLLLSLLAFPSAAMWAAVWLAIAAAPYVVYSIAYQRFVAHSWCRLCLGVQLALLLNLGVALWVLMGVGMPVFSPRALVGLLVIGMAVAGALAAAKPLINSYIAHKAEHAQHLRLKHRAEVRNLLLHETASVAPPAASEAIAWGAPDAVTTITLVVSPICEPCQHELRTLLPLLLCKTETRVELVFFVDPAPQSADYRLAQHLLTQHGDNPRQLLQGLHVYAQHYPASRVKIERGLASPERSERLEAMGAWCKRNRLHSTPMIFINHHKLPKIYATEEIDYLCG